MEHAFGKVFHAVPILLLETGGVRPSGRTVVCRRDREIPRRHDAAPTLDTIMPEVSVSEEGERAMALGW
jgi:hypothetical protein